MTFETIIVAVGRDFSVRLKSTPTTGYVWEVHTLPEGVQFLGSDYEKPARGIKPGDPVVQTFRFRLLKKREHIINFILKRQWESNAIESHTLTVKSS